VEPPEITFNDDGDFVSIWVGSFGTEAAAEAFVEPDYSEREEDAPLSAFAVDIGLKCYEDDFRELNFEVGLSGKEAGAFSVHSYGESFAAAAWQAVRLRGIGEFDMVVMLYGYNHAIYPQMAKQPAQVSYVGTFPFVQ
jgi:hypothetical protein